MLESIGTSPSFLGLAKGSGTGQGPACRTPCPPRAVASEMRGCPVTAPRKPPVAGCSLIAVLKAHFFLSPGAVAARANQ